MKPQLAGLPSLVATGPSQQMMLNKLQLVGGTSKTGTKLTRDSSESIDLSEILKK